MAEIISLIEPSSQSSEPARQHSPATNFLLKAFYVLAGFFVISIGLAVAFFASYVSYYLILIGAALSLTIIMVGIRFIRKGQRYTLHDGRALMDKDRRPPLVYLRSFLSHTFTSERVDQKTNNELLSTILSEFGPVVAIAEPGQSRPPLGPAWYYVKEGEDWIEVVRSLAEKARFILISPGVSEGLITELKIIKELDCPEKLLVMLTEFAQLSPDAKKRQYAQFRSLAQEHWKIELPETIDKEAFLTFTREWNPIFLKPSAYYQAFYRRSGFFKQALLEINTSSILRDTLRGFLDHHGLRFGTLRILKSYSAFFLNLTIFVLFFISFVAGLAFTIKQKVQAQMEIQRQKYSSTPQRH